MLRTGDLRRVSFVIYTALVANQLYAANTHDSAALTANEHPTEQRKFFFDDVTTRMSLQWFTVAGGQDLAESSFNPGNAYARLAEGTGIVDLRPNLKVIHPRWQLLAKPQARFDATSVRYDQAPYQTPSDRQHKIEYDSNYEWLELYGAWTLSDDILFSYGKQNYQWGAAETLNPSNRIFHESITNKNLLYTVKGKRLMRVNLSWSKDVTSVLILEPTEEYKDDIYRAEETFEPKLLLKNEIAWNSGADYVGVVLGSGPSSWVGEYFNFSLTDGLSFYGDASHEKGSRAWYPVKEQTLQQGVVEVVNLRQSKDNDVIYTLGVAGLRYSFEGGSDIRMEYVANTAGWSKDEMQLGVQALDWKRQEQLRFLQTNSQRWFRPGLEFRGQRYGMVSLRMVDLFNVKDLTFYVRGLHSLTDKSESYYGSMEYAVGDSTTLLLSGFGTRGEADQDLRGLVASSVLGGVRQDF